MVFLVILFVVLLIAAIVVAISQNGDKRPQAQVVCATKLRNKVASSNPIDGIRLGGVMGFELGDSYEFCLSRFKHLNLLINDDELANGSYSGIVAWGKNTFNNVNEVRFVFDNKKLASIVIDIDFSKEGVKDMYGILVSRICRILGTEPIFSDTKQTAWASAKAKNGIILFRHLIPIMEEENLLIQIGSLQ